MPKRRTLVLSPEQEAELIAHRDHDKRPYLRERCAAFPWAVAAWKLTRWSPRSPL